MAQLPEESPDNWIEPMYKKQLEQSTQFISYMTLYKNRIAMGEDTPRYKTLKDLVSFFLADVQSQNHIKSLSLPQPALPAVKPDTPKQKREDCKPWLRKGKCPKKDGSCPFVHDPAKLSLIHI